VGSGLDHYITRVAFVVVAGCAALAALVAIIGVAFHQLAVARAFTDWPRRRAEPTS
jgi:hypothetical protein